MQHLFYHLSNEAVGNSSLCIDRLPRRSRTCDHDLSARNLDWILKLRDHPGGGKLVSIAMYIDDVQLMLEAIRIGAPLISVHRPSRIGPLVTRYLLEVGLTDKSGAVINDSHRYWLQFFCGKHQLFDLLDSQFPKPIDAVTANRLWRACPLPSMREWLGEFPYKFEEEDLYAKEHLRQGLDHILELSIQHSIYLNFPRLITAFLEIDDRDSITRLWYPRDSEVAKMLSDSLDEDGDGYHAQSFPAQMATWWRDLPLEDWKFIWELMHIDHQDSIRNYCFFVSTTSVADWLSSLGFREVFLVDAIDHFEWKRSNGIHQPLPHYDHMSCALLGAHYSINPLTSLSKLFGCEISVSTQVLMYAEEIGTSIQL